MVNYGNAAGLLNPSGDTTGATDTARIQTAVASGVELAEGTFYTNATITLDTSNVLRGVGANGTIISAASGFTGSSMIALTTPATSAQVQIENVTLIPNTGTVGGVYLDNTGFSPAIFDSRHILRNVFVKQAAGDSFRFSNNIRGMSAINCQSYWSEGYGFKIDTGTTDNQFTNCVSGQSKNHGFYVNDSNNLFTGCRSFWAGYDHNAASWGTTQCGFEITSAVSYTSFVSCLAQQAALHGFDLQGCTHVTVTGCESDSNSSGVSTGVGVNTNGAQNCMITGVTGALNGGLSPAAQKYGIQVAGTQTNTMFWGNTVTGSSGQFNYVSGSGYTSVNPSTADLSNVATLKLGAPTFGNQGAPQSLSNGNTITVQTYYGIYPVTNSGNVTGIILSAPADTWAMVTIINEGTGTVAFAASGTSHVADGAATPIAVNGARTLVYDANTSLWYRVSL